uniref:Anaphase-promoting complex subunit 4 WD40 domain-containing protein n=1 Tax=Rhodosorus marinus TaxID=101924 RepID=A0A7S3E5V6_9RHOD|mmetsp:Transcript_11395/g.47437  ORF Transcript_11395/g.47437 Transcript_11395/m.47437 type:complete len:252 (+) Transcript_11395:233-988(+)
MNLDGRVAVTGDDLGQIKVIDVGNCKVVFQASISSRDDQRKVAITHLCSRGASDNFVICTSDGAVHQLLNFRDVATVPGNLKGGTVGIGELDERRALFCSPAGEVFFLQDEKLIPSSMKVGNNVQCMQTSRHERILSVAGKEHELELWDLQHEKSTFRAKNVASDELGLRVPVDNRCIAFASEKDTRIVAVGTGLGRLRLYDTRCGQRRPVQDLDTSLNRRNGIPSACTAIDVWNRGESGTVVVRNLNYTV